MAPSSIIIPRIQENGCKIQVWMNRNSTRLSLTNCFSSHLILIVRKQFLPFLRAADAVFRKAKFEVKNFLLKDRKNQWN